jgi:hypothetical protein
LLNRVQRVAQVRGVSTESLVNLLDLLRWEKMP